MANKSRIITFTQYQELAVRTDKYREAYGRIMGLQEEAGELCGVLAKNLRDDKSFFTSDVKKRCVEELGDVVWQVASNLSARGIGMAHAAGQDDILSFVMSVHPEKYDKNNLPEIATWLFAEVGNLARYLIAPRADNSFVIKSAENCIRNCAIISRRVSTGLVSVCNRNIDKLSDRADRGVIGGSGDYR